MREPVRKTRLWDLPVRLVHWSFVVLLPLLWWSAEEHDVDLHKTLGYVMLALVLFRIIWGFIGSSNARFASFVKGPSAVFGYLRKTFGGENEVHAGHNPAGGWSVVILLLLLATQVGIGLFTQDVDGTASGPLTYLVSYETADTMRERHELIFNLIILFVIVHLAAIIFYSVVRKDRLVPPMVTGSRDLPESVEAPRIAPLWKAALALAFAAAFAWWISKGAPTSWQELTAPPQPTMEDYM
ncbi:MAG: cytochrome b/b6 domain-containing protein [Novosphingobium sp.]